MLARPQTLGDHERKAALLRSGLLDSPVEEAFDRATRLASRVIGAPVSLVSIVDGDRQFFKSQVGLPEPWATDRQTPLSHSFCQYVVMRGDSLVVADAREDAILRDNRAIEDLGVVAYLGVPIIDGSGNVLGSFCVIDDQAREWTEEEEELLRDVAEQVHVLLLQREALESARQAELRRRNVSAAITHDLRGPVTNIVAAASMLGEVPETERSTFVDIIRRQSARIDRLVSGLASAERAGDPTRMRVVDLASHVQTVVASAFEGMHSARIDIGPAPEGLKVQVDADAVGQVVLNLVDNALRHGAPAGRVGVEVAETGDELEISVRNEVHGHALDVASLLGDGDSGSAARRRPGLGLHICQAVLEALGGRLVATRAGDEVTFTAVLPAAVVEPWRDGIG
jgi:signal transduction histidine kinase